MIVLFFWSSTSTWFQVIRGESMFHTRLWNGAITRPDCNWKTPNTTSKMSNDWICGHLWVNTAPILRSNFFIIKSSIKIKTSEPYNILICCKISRTLNILSINTLLWGFLQSFGCPRRSLVRTQKNSVTVKLIEQSNYQAYPWVKIFLRKNKAWWALFPFSRNSKWLSAFTAGQT